METYTHKKIYIVILITLLIISGIINITQKHKISVLQEENKNLEEINSISYELILKADETIKICDEIIGEINERNNINELGN